MAESQPQRCHLSLQPTLAPTHHTGVNEMTLSMHEDHHSPAPASTRENSEGAHFHVSCSEVLKLTWG